MSEAKLTLFYGPGSSSMAPHIALWEVGATFSAKLISFAREEQRSPAYLAINPAGKVPTLLVDEQPLTEVAAILFYLAERYPDAQLLPDEPLERAQVVSWMSFIASTVQPARRQGWSVVREVYSLVERRLAMRAWAGPRYSIADIHLFRLYWRIRNAYAPGPDEFPGLEAHYHRMMARTAVQKTCAIESADGYELPDWRGPDQALI